MIDLTNLQYLLADAQRNQRSVVEVPYNELQALLHKVEAIQKIEEHIPKKIGYGAPDEIRELCCGRGKTARIKRSPFSDFVVPIYFLGQLPRLELPTDETPLAVVADL